MNAMDMNAIQMLKDERATILEDVARIDKAIDILGGTVATTTARKARKPLSDEQRKAAGDRMRKYWEAKRAEKATATEPQPRLVRTKKPTATGKPQSEAEAQPTPDTAT